MSTEMNFRRRKICWISFLILDFALCKTSRIEILRKLASRGYDTSLFAVCSREKFQPGTNDVRLVPIPLRYVPSLSMLMYTLLLIVYLPFYFIHSKPDFVIIEPREPTFLALILPSIFPKSVRPKTILDIRSTPVGGYSEILVFKTAVLIAKRLFDGMTIITSMMKKEICDAFHIDEESVGVWTSGVSTAHFNPRDYNRNSLRKMYGLGNRFVIFYHGALGQSLPQVKNRGICESIKSIRILKDKYPDLVLFLLGDSRSFRFISKFAEECGVQDRVILHDEVRYEDVPRYIAVCDVGLVPLPDLTLWRHQCPLKLLEYLAMKKVVIATDIPANRNIVGKCECGIFIPSSRPEEIAKAITYVHDNRDRITEWGAYGRSIVAERYDWEKVTDDFEKYLKDLEKRNPKTR